MRNELIAGLRFHASRLSCSVRLFVQGEEWVGLLGDLSDNLLLVLVQRDQRSRLGEAQRYREEFPVAGREHGSHRQVESEPQGQCDLVAPSPPI